MQHQSFDELQCKIKAIWAELLTTDKVGYDDSFFELGGDSVSMLDMLFTLGEEIGVSVDPSLIFEDPSLGGFSKLVYATLNTDSP